MQRSVESGLVRTGVTGLKRARPITRTARQIVWTPARSRGGVLGISLAVASSVGAATLGMTAVLTTSPATRLVALLLEVPVLLLLGTCMLGTWRWFTLAYALAPTALEIRYGTRRFRVRYDDIVDVTVPEPGESGLPSVLWPEAPAGDQCLTSGLTARWWGTTSRPEARVLVETTSGALLLTPASPLAFRDALRANARGDRAAVAPRAARRGWLDMVAGFDPGFRILAALAVAVAIAGLAGQVLVHGASSHHATLATFGLLATMALAGPVARHAPHAGRVAMAATLALQCLGVLL